MNRRREPSPSYAKKRMPVIRTPMPISGRSCSKAKLIGDLTKQIDLNYQTRLQDLQARLLETVRTARETRKWAAALVALLLLAIVLILIRIG